MNNKQRIIFVLALVVLQILPGLIAGNTLLAQEREKLLFKEIPIVITASRREQPITEAPTTITVINAEDIRYSGATTIPEVLSMVAGVDVMTISARDQQVGVRGFISPLNNKLLVLVDGRTMYTDLYGAVFWDLFPIGLEEIHRIEVVKSPASSIYGANAFCGVINIITKSPQQLLGTTLNFTAGDHSTLIGSIIHAGTAMNEKFKYKMSAEWDQTNRWQKYEDLTPHLFRTNAMLQYSIGNNSSLALSAGRGHTKDRKFLSGESIGTGIINYRNDYLQLDGHFGNLKFRTFYKNEKPLSYWPLTSETQVANIESLNTELLHHMVLGNNQTIMWGINYQFNKLVKNFFIPNDHRQHLWALFFEDEIKLSPKIRVTLGARYDDHPLVPGHFSPRGSLLYTPAKNHIFRFSFAQAYRNPSMVDSYIYLERQLSFTLPAPLPPIIAPYVFISQGNPNLKPEGITSYEFGYHTIGSKRFTLDVNLFYNHYNNFFLLIRKYSFYKENELFPRSPGGVFPKEIKSLFQNKGDAMGLGGEINAAFSFNEHISGFANYSFQKIKDFTDNPTTANINEKDRVRPENPKHKVNAGLRFILDNGLSLNCLAHWVDNTQKLLNDQNGITTLKTVAGYFIVNTRVGYTFWHKKAELAFSVFNLFNRDHLEYPRDETALLPESESIGRRFTLALKLKF